MSIEYRLRSLVRIHPPNAACSKSGLPTPRLRSLWAVLRQSHRTQGYEFAPEASIPAATVVCPDSSPTRHGVSARDHEQRQQIVRIPQFRDGRARHGDVTETQTTTAAAHFLGTSLGLGRRSVMAVPPREQAGTVGPDCFSTGIPPRIHAAVGAAPYARRHAHLRRSSWPGSSSPTTRTLFGYSS
jgi:hypothetical protein